MDADLPRIMWQGSETTLAFCAPRRAWTGRWWRGGPPAELAAPPSLLRRTWIFRQSPLLPWEGSKWWDEESRMWGACRRRTWALCVSREGSAFASSPRRSQCSRREPETYRSSLERRRRCKGSASVRLFLSEAWITLSGYLCPSFLLQWFNRQQLLPPSPTSASHISKAKILKNRPWWKIPKYGFISLRDKFLLALTARLITTFDR